MNFYADVDDSWYEFNALFADGKLQSIELLSPLPPGQSVIVPEQWQDDSCQWSERVSLLRLSTLALPYETVIAPTGTGTPTNQPMDLADINARNKDEGNSATATISVQIQTKKKN